MRPDKRDIGKIIRVATTEGAGFHAKVEFIGRRPRKRLFYKLAIRRFPRAIGDFDTWEVEPNLRCIFCAHIDNVRIDGQIFRLKRDEVIYA